MDRRGVPAATIDAVRAVALFADVPAEALERIASQARVRQLAAGDWLFREGDPGDSVFIVDSGRLDVLIEAPEPTVIREAGRGSVIGELALLTGRPRGASVRARRDSELLMIDRDDFVGLLTDEPAVTLALTRALGAQLQPLRLAAYTVPPPPSTIAVMAAGGGVELDVLADELEAALGRLGSVARLAANAGDDPPPGALDRLERSHDRVLLVGSLADNGDAWSGACLRQADRVLLVGDARLPPPGGGSSTTTACDLALVTRGGRPRGISEWLAAVDPRTVHLVRDESRELDIARMARRLAGRSVGVVLSGGGARAFAHIGALAELAASGIVIDRVGGCSMGAYVGGLFCATGSTDDVAARCREEFVVRNPLTDYTLPLVAFTRGRRGQAMLARTFGDLRIEELDREFFCNACDLATSTAVELRRGSLASAVGATLALPGFVPPVVIGDRILVDGGVLNNLPVEAMASRGEGPVIAVDVTAPTRRPTHAPRRAVGRRLRRMITGVDEAPLGLADALTRSVVLGSSDTLDAARRHADLVIAPEQGDVEMLDWHQLDRMLEAGRAATRAALAATPAALGI